jgi:hypothetical protein
MVLLCIFTFGSVSDSIKHISILDPELFIPHLTFQEVVDLSPQNIVEGVCNDYDDSDVLDGLCDCDADDSLMSMTVLMTVTFNVRAVLDECQVRIHDGLAVMPVITSMTVMLVESLMVLITKFPLCQLWRYGMNSAVSMIHTVRTPMCGQRSSGIQEIEWNKSGSFSNTFVSLVLDVVE